MNPNVTTTFYFDSGDFAVELATKCGQLKEYPIQETEVYCEVPDPALTSNYPCELDLGDC